MGDCQVYSGSRTGIRGVVRVLLQDPADRQVNVLVPGRQAFLLRERVRCTFKGKIQRRHKTYDWKKHGVEAGQLVFPAMVGSKSNPQATIERHSQPAMRDEGGSGSPLTALLVKFIPSSWIVCVVVVHKSLSFALPGVNPALNAMWDCTVLELQPPGPSNLFSTTAI